MCFAAGRDQPQPEKQTSRDMHTTCLADQQGSVRVGCVCVLISNVLASFLAASTPTSSAASSVHRVICRSAVPKAPKNSNQQTNNTSCVRRRRFQFRYFIFPARATPPGGGGRVRNIDRKTPHLTLSTSSNKILVTGSSCPDENLLSSSGLAPPLLSFSVGML